MNEEWKRKKEEEEEKEIGPGSVACLAFVAGLSSEVAEALAQKKEEEEEERREERRKEEKKDKKEERRRTCSVLQDLVLAIEGLTESSVRLGRLAGSRCWSPCKACGWLTR